MARPVLALDIDEVCAQFVPALIRYHNDKFGTSLSAETFHSYTFSEVWGGTDAEGVEKVYDFFATKYFLEELQPVEGAVEAVTALVQAGFDVVGVVGVDADLAVVVARAPADRDVIVVGLGP